TEKWSEALSSLPSPGTPGEGRVRALLEKPKRFDYHHQLCTAIFFFSSSPPPPSPSLQRITPPKWPGSTTAKSNSAQISTSAAPSPISHAPPMTSTSLTPGTRAARSKCPTTQAPTPSPRATNNP